jgi:predicted permease
VSAILLTLLAGLAFGIVPAFQAARTDLRSVYTGGRGVAGRKRFVSLGALVGGQVALSIPLLTAAGLLLHTFLYLWNLNPGFDPSHVLTARFSLQDARYATSQKMNQLFDNTLDRLRQTPGIEVAAASLSLPYERGLNMGVRLPGQERSSVANMNYVTPDFFAALRIPLLQGRLLTAVDGPRSAHTAVVNQAFVKRYFKNGDPLGKPLGVSGTQTEIVGVVGDIQARSAGWGDFGPLAPVPTVYVPATQFGDLGVHIWFSPSWIVRSSLPGREITAAIGNATHSADPLLPMAEFRSINDVKAESLSLQKLMAALAGALAGLAMVLSAMGIYGLTANLVADRTQELGIRMALGSSVAGAIQLALKPALTWVFAGIVAGSLAAVGIERFLKTFLWGVQPNDPWTLAVVGLTLLVATALASLLPALRIVRLNPADTLRAE